MASFINYRPEGVYIIEREGRNHRRIGGLDLYTPRTSEEVRFRMMMEARLRQIATPGTYTGQEANRLIQSLCVVADSELTRVLPKVASRNFFEFLVFMHRQWGRLITKMQHGEIDDHDANLCWAEAPIERRTLRYLLEKSVQLAPPEQPEAERVDVLSFADRAYIAARQLVELSNCSDQLHYLYPTGEAHVIVLPPRQERYFEFQLNPAAETRYKHYRHMNQEFFQFVGREEDDAGELMQLLNERLNTPFSQEFGITFRQVITCCSQLKHFVRLVENSFDVFFVPEQRLYEAIADYCSYPRDAVQCAMAGLILTKESLDREKRDIVNTKQHFQARYRPFAKVPHPLGPHLAWDTDTLTSILANEVIYNISFGKLPDEWKRGKISVAVNNIQQELDRRFVYKVRQQFEECRWKCVIEVKRLRDAYNISHRIENDPGEIDVLAVSPDGKIIAQVECKRVSPSDDAHTYRDDLSDFYGSGKFVEKAKRKRTWLVKNHAVVVHHLKRATGIEVSDNAKIRPLFLTLYPNFAATRASEIPILPAKIFFKELSRDVLFWPSTNE